MAARSAAASPGSHCGARIANDFILRAFPDAVNAAMVRGKPRHAGGAAARNGSGAVTCRTHAKFRIVTEVYDSITESQPVAECISPNLIIGGDFRRYSMLR